MNKPNNSELKDWEEEYQSQLAEKDKKKRKKMKVSGAGVKKLQKIIKKKNN